MNEIDKHIRDVLNGELIMSTSNAQHIAVGIRCPECNNLMVYVGVDEPSGSDDDRELLKDEIQELAERRDAIKMTAQDFETIEKSDLLYMYCRNRGCGMHGLAKLAKDRETHENELLYFGPEKRRMKAFDNSQSGLADFM